MTYTVMKCAAYSNVSDLVFRVVLLNIQSKKIGWFYLEL